MIYHLNMTTIILAAGLSSRMGCNKMLLQYKGKPLISHVIEQAYSLSDKIIVVLGNERNAIEAAISPYRCQIAFNKDFEKGQMCSIKCGLEASDDDFAFVPGDLPLLLKNDFESIFNALSFSECVRPIYNAIPGHPIAYKRKYRERILSFPGNMKEFNKTVQLSFIKGSIGTVFDIDTADRYDSLLRSETDLSILDRSLNWMCNR